MIFRENKLFQRKNRKSEEVKVRKEDRKRSANLDERKNDGISRRNFLKVASTLPFLGGAGELVKWLLKDLEENFYNEAKEERKEEANEGRGLIRRKILSAPTEEQRKIEHQDVIMVGKTIEEQLKEGKRVKLNRETKKAIYLKWYKSYAPEGENHLGLKRP